MEDTYFSMLKPPTKAHSALNSVTAVSYTHLIQIIIKVTITLASGKKQVISITVQKTTVRTIKITGLKSSVTVARNKKLTLKPVISPITSQEKVTCSSSNKKSVTLNSKGVITGKKKGTAYITVKSGKIRKKVKVVVK